MDEQGDATQAVTCFTKMCDQGITGLIGDVTTTPTLAVVAESQDYNMPMVTASATAVLISESSSTLGFKGAKNAAIVILAKLSLTERAEKVSFISFLSMSHPLLRLP